MSRDLADKLDVLFSTVLSPDGDAYTYSEVAQGTNHVVSASYAWNLRTGKKANPSREKLTALARFFGVQPSYFFEEEPIRPWVDMESKLFEAIRDARVREIALRVSELNDSSKEFILAMIRKAKELADDE